LQAALVEEETGVVSDNIPVDVADYGLAADDVYKVV